MLLYLSRIYQYSILLGVFVFLTTFYFYSLHFKKARYLRKPRDTAATSSLAVPGPTQSALQTVVSATATELQTRQCQSNMEQPEEVEAEPSITHPRPYLNELFEFVGEKDNSWRIRCLLCKPKKKKTNNTKCWPSKTPHQTSENTSK